eukprot:COSAG01_NODE_37315_length_505_cov_0.849754_1_plen_116_part_01
MRHPGQALQLMMAHLNPGSPKPVKQSVTFPTGCSGGRSVESRSTDGSCRRSSSSSLAQPLLPRPHGPECDPPGADCLGLSVAEVEFFKENGYLIKRGLVPPDALAPLVQGVWEQTV